MTTKKVYIGKTGDDRFYLSKFDKTIKNRPCNWYASSDEAVRHAAERGLTVEWEAE